jgi:hypothetical protein
MPALAIPSGASDISSGQESQTPPAATIDRYPGLGLVSADIGRTFAR